MAVQEGRLKGAMSDLEKAQALLDAKEAELRAAQAEYDKAMSEKQALVDDAETCRRKMSAASTLINGLGGEKERWTEQSKEFMAQIGRLVGDILICTAFLSYSGPFNQDVRILLNKNWMKELKNRQIPYSMNLKIVELLVDPTQGCMCNSYRVTCNNLQHIPALNTGVDVSQIFDLSFQDGNITSIPNNSLPSGLTSFVLFRNPLTNIFDDAFDTSATTLQKVYITRAQFKNLPTALKKLTRLIDLHLEDTPIQEWDAATLKQISATLEYLTLRNVSLSAWPSWIWDFHLLRTVDLGSIQFYS